MATRNDALSEIYARSLHELAREEDRGEAVSEVAGELEVLAGIVKSEPSFAEFLRSPLIDAGARGRTIDACFRGHLGDLVLRFLLVLNRKGRMGHLVQIQEAYAGLVREDEGRIGVEITMASEIHEQQLQVIRDRVRAVFDREPDFETHVDASMLGGIRLRIGDMLIDGSVSSRLGRMRQGIQASGSTQVRERIDSIIESEAVS